ncbi:LIC13341 family surface-exposed protein [Leptospira ilyithenensis]|uniref:Uncharacterized protein n=1 Tax=Leptospira ilyithenensis TaxID=2484901 RepID=A0A4R9LS32_9LEPT|nr:hypothetical protein [Leptospira ilyithenensis]TGN11056.1 hypothetical protein EHS11_07800 [Leptospira ilyithenensis]
MSHYLRGILLLLSLFLLLHCQGSEVPSDDLVTRSLYGENTEQVVRVIGAKVINLDENPDLEAIVLSQSGQTEAISAYKKEGRTWKFLWKQEFNQLTLGSFYYDLKKLSWESGTIPGREKKILEGDCIRRVVLAELAGDSFNSVFVEVLSEEPPMGLFSIPFGYRKGVKILDGLQLKEHEELVRTKRLEFEYSPKEKSVRIFPTNPNYSQEFIFNGWEMIPNLPMQPVPSFVSLEVEPKLEIGKESKVTLQLKNRGNYTTVTYLSLSFPGDARIRLDENTKGLRFYNKGATVYNIVQNKQISSTQLLLEATKEGWGSNYKYGISFYYTPMTKENQRFLFRSSFKFYKEIVSIPNRFSINKTEIDQQGFHTYPMLMDVK